MKKIILPLFLLALAFPAQAQVNQTTILTPLTPAHILSYTSTSKAITSNFTSSTRAVRAICTTACFLQFGVSGTTPVAVANGGVTASTHLAANVPEYFSVEPNGKVAVIQLSSGGVLYLQEMGR